MRCTHFFHLLWLSVYARVSSGQASISHLDVLCELSNSQQTSEIIVSNGKSSSKLIIRASSHPFVCNIFNKLINVAGIRPQALQLAENSIIPFARHLTASDKHYIVYNYDDFLDENNGDQLDTMAITSALAHELGHYLNHHGEYNHSDTLYHKYSNILWSRDERKDLELDADYYLGYILKSLSYSKQQAANFLLRTSSPDWYPPIPLRATSIANGINNAGLRISAEAFADANPRVICTDSAYTVWISGVIRVTNNATPPWNVYSRTVSIYYDKENNSTYQLNFDVPQYKGYRWGLGRLVNNRTSFVYMKTGEHSYQVYNRAKLIMINQCKNAERTPKLGYDKKLEDYLVYCTDITDGKMKYILLKDYGYASKFQLMPAIVVSDPSAIGR